MALIEPDTRALNYALVIQSFENFLPIFIKGISIYLCRNSAINKDKEVIARKVKTPLCISYPKRNFNIGINVNKTA